MQLTMGALDIEGAIDQNFDEAVKVGRIILPWSPVGRTAEAAVFMTTDKKLMLYLQASSSMTVADVKKVMSRMGLKAAEFYPPKYQPDYFDIIGYQKFQEVFPGMKVRSDEDLIFYRTLAPYNPALVQISEIKHGEIYKFDPDTHGEWRVGARFAYRRLQPS